MRRIVVLPDDNVGIEENPPQDRRCRAIFIYLSGIQRHWDRE